MGKEKQVLMTPDEVADVLRVARKTVVTMAREGRIPHIRMGRLYRFDPAEINRWLDQNHRH